MKRHSRYCFIYSSFSISITIFQGIMWYWETDELTRYSERDFHYWHHQENPQIRADKSENPLLCSTGLHSQAALWFLGEPHSACSFPLIMGVSVAVGQTRFELQGVWILTVVLPFISLEILNNVSSFFYKMWKNDMHFLSWL